MTRLAAGDYLLVSNDRERLWRIHAYVDGSAHGLIDVGYEERRFWRLLWMPVEQARQYPTVDDLPDPWGDDGDHRRKWVEEDWYLPTRQACIDRAMAKDAERAAALDQMAPS